MVLGIGRRTRAEVALARLEDDVLVPAELVEVVRGAEVGGRALLVLLMVLRIVRLDGVVLEAAVAAPRAGRVRALEVALLVIRNRARPGGQGGRRGRRRGWSRGRRDNPPGKGSHVARDPSGTSSRTGSKLLCLSFSQSIDYWSREILAL